MEKRAFFGRIADKLAAFVEKVVGVFRTALGLNPPKEEWHAQSNFSNAHNWKTASDIAPVVGKTCSAPALAHKRAQLEEEVVLKKRRADAVRSAIASAGDGREIDEKQLYEKADGDAAEALCNYHEAAARQARAEQVKQLVEEVNSQLKAIEAEGGAEAVEDRFRSGEKDMGGLTGWVEYVGRVGRRPAAFRLVKGGEVQFLLRSVKYDLADFVNRRVAVDGAVEEAPGFEANVLVVDYLRVLGDPPESIRDQKVEIRRPDVPETPLPLPPETPAPATGAENAENPVGVPIEGKEALPTVVNERDVPVVPEGTNMPTDTAKPANPPPVPPLDDAKAPARDVEADEKIFEPAP